MKKTDSRLMIYVADCVKRGQKSVAIQTVDTDVVALSAAVAAELDIAQLWVAFGSGKAFRDIGVHLILQNIGINRSKALPMFHSLTGGDTVSSFAGRGKKLSWGVWNVFPALTDALLSLTPPSITFPMDVLDDIQSFVVLLYSRTCDLNNVNKARKQLFS